MSKAKTVAKNPTVCISLKLLAGLSALFVGSVRRSRLSDHNAKAAKEMHMAIAPKVSVQSKHLLP
jgi:hypothetical protein